jgi:hypothetical protein
MPAMRAVLCLAWFAGLVFGQGAQGIITGTITDPSGAMVANAPVAVRHLATGQVFATNSTVTGNYTLAQLPVGAYDLTVALMGFKTYNRTGLDLAAAQTMRIDIPLEVGSQTESVTVTAEATLLKTETSALVHNVTVSQMNQLPILALGGAGQTNTSGFRDPFALARLLPGIQYVSANTMVVNGVPDDTIQIRLEGQTSGNTGPLRQFTNVGQPSVDAVQEVAVQTSNYSAEFGTVGGGIFNVTMKSGTNQFHGSAYDYAANEVLNAHQPYTGLRPTTKRHNYGFTIGGPVWIPKLYNGRNRSFFFLGWERFRENQLVTNSVVTVPIDPYRRGDFTQVIVGNGNAQGPLPIQVAAGRNYVDPLGRSYSSGSIFDQTTERLVRCDTTAVPNANCANGSDILVRDQFPGNLIPASRFDPVSLKVLALVPGPTGPNHERGQVGGNFQNPWVAGIRSRIPSIKADQSIGEKHRLSFFYNNTDLKAQYSTPNGNAEGLPEPITNARGSFIFTHTYRLTWNYNMTPTLLLTVGAGFFQHNFSDRAPVLNYDAFKELGLRGTLLNRNFPTIVVGSAGNTTGGMSNLGPAGAIQGTGTSERRPSGVANVTWVRGNHTIKIGGEWRGERYPTRNFGASAGLWTFGSNSTQQTALQAVPTTQGVHGFNFASFLMGDLTAVTLTQPSAISTGKQQWALFVQDTWKVTRKLTLDYGLRWDLGGYARERFGRTSNFSPTVPNPSAGGHPGGQIFEATCQCNFADVYALSVGPRLGAAYQLNSRTVFRAGFGIVYMGTGTAAGTVSSNAVTGTPGFGQTVGKFRDGVPPEVKPRFPVFEPNVGQANNAVVGGPTNLDPNATRPARQYQWSIGLQREITRDLVVEASYVANRGVWWSAGGLAPVNVTSVDLLASYGFQVGNTADATLLTRQLGQLTAAQRSTLAARGVFMPYNGYPTNLTVRQSLNPFPQYSGTLAPAQAPLGKTWYDGLQITVIQRFSRGLMLNANYTFSKNLDLMSSPDVFNRDWGKDISNNDLPHQFRLTTEYQVPSMRNLGLPVLSNRIVSYILADWGLGWYLQYQSAGVLGRPGSTSQFPISQWLGRGPGGAQLKTGPDGKPMSPWAVNWTDYDGKVHPEPIDINCRCFDPTKTIVLNPNAWENIPDGQWGAQQNTIRYYRGIRQPLENANLSRTFRIKEGITFNVRVEFQNVFNRLRLPNPSTANFQAQPLRFTSGANTGLYSSGFGTIVPVGGTGGSRTGLFIGRLIF